MIWKRLFADKALKNTYDVIVSGNSLSAYIAAYSAYLNELNVAWFNAPATPQKSNIDTDTPRAQGFDSLAPEGVRYLNHLLDIHEINRISTGTFGGIYRNGQYQAFDKILGSGIQLNVDQLKSMLMKKIKNRVPVFNDQAIALEGSGQYLRVNTRSGGHCHCRWLINAEGQHSLLSRQKVEYLSDPLWVSRALGKIATNNSNTVRFEQKDQGWAWLAYDKHGRECKTQWQQRTLTSQSEASKAEKTFNRQYFNSRWYRRKDFVECVDGVSRVLLTVPTCYRFDPAAGLGMALQIKSAMLAIHCILDCGKAADEIAIHANQYRHHIESSFNDITEGMVPFYRNYGVRFPGL